MLFDRPEKLVGDGGFPGHLVLLVPLEGEALERDVLAWGRGSREKAARLPWGKYAP
jgi:hypothetical protein